MLEREVDLLLLAEKLEDPPPMLDPPPLLRLLPPPPPALKLPVETPPPLLAAALACAPVIHAQALLFAVKSNTNAITPNLSILLILTSVVKCAPGPFENSSAVNGTYAYYKRNP
jgi:hypothetical protein